MKRKTQKHGFTLVELLVVMSIIGVLSVILFRTFGTVSELAFRVEQEKNVTKEIIDFSQILQNYADKNTVDFEKYGGTRNGKRGTGNADLELVTSDADGLTTTNGLTDILYLSGQDGRVAFYTSGDCIQPGEALLSGAMDSECALYLQKDEQIIQLTNPKKTHLSQAVFKIIPFASQEQYLNGSGADENTNVIYSLNKPGFWLFVQVRNARFSPSNRGNNIEIPVQQFFTLK